MTESSIVTLLPATELCEAVELTVREQVARRLRSLIIEGVYLPGQRLVERELCDKLNVSRPSVRESLRQLEAEGLVTIVPHRGPMVRVVTASEVMELWEVRHALECVIVRRLVSLATDQEIDELERRVDELDVALKSEKPSQIRLAKSIFVECFASGAHSETIANYYRLLVARLSFLWSSSLMFPGRSSESIGEYRTMLAAIRSRNAEAAHAAMVLHNEKAKAVAMYGARVFEETLR